MKKQVCLLLLAALMLLSGCEKGWGEPKVDSECTEKPAIYLYPDSAEETEESAPAEKPAIYLYPEDEQLDEKPVLYLSPEQTTTVTVKLDLDGVLTCAYPAYKDGWTVEATPDGTLTDATGRQYPYLFWEGVTDADWDMSRGFVVPGADTAAFLEETLGLLGLTDRETTDFITYWLPRMQDNAYNLIAFQGEVYTEAAKLTVTPEPDTVLRVFMAFQPLEEPVDIEPQVLEPTERTGFTVVEWGGCELK